jgi:hypothetical protein
MSDLHDRVTRLEQSARRWRLAAGSLLLVIAGGVLMGQVTLGGGTGGMRAPLITGDRLVANQSLTVNDADGKPRLVLSGDASVPVIQVKDKDDHTLLAISSDAKGTSIVITDAAGKKIFSAP